MIEENKRYQSTCIGHPAMHVFFHHHGGFSLLEASQAVVLWSKEVDVDAFPLFGIKVDQLGTPFEAAQLEIDSCLKFQTSSL